MQMKSPRQYINLIKENRSDRLVITEKAFYKYAHNLSIYDDIRLFNIQYSISYNHPMKPNA